MCVCTFYVRFSLDGGAKQDREQVAAVQIWRTCPSAYIGYLLSIADRLLPLFWQCRKHVPSEPTAEVTLVRPVLT